MADRKHRLVDCDPHWVCRGGSGSPNAVYFECPEGHDDCHRVIPFSPALDGAQQPDAWGRIGTTFETLTLTPSVRGIPRYANREAAIADGCLPEHIRGSMFCAVHVNITNGAIEFHGDSK